MANPSLNWCIIASLQQQEMHPDLPQALLTQNKSRAYNRVETQYWDYKETLSLKSRHERGELAKDIIAFHNTEGGAIIIGITKNYTVRGVTEAVMVETKILRDSIRAWVSSKVNIFTAEINVSPGRYVWLIFIAKRSGAPLPMLSNGPNIGPGKSMFRKDDYFYRDHDEVRRCSDDDLERLFQGFSTEGLNPYTYQVDERYFRLLSPNCKEFIGRRTNVDEVKDALLNGRSPVVTLDGLGGVGKTEIAIQAVRELYDAAEYDFIVSISAKSRVWIGHIHPRTPGFAGFKGLLDEIATVLDISRETDESALKRAIVAGLKGWRGLLVIDNLEDIQDSNVLYFLRREVPDPIRVLITSRVNKKVGSETISVPKMDSNEAEDLMRKELKRLGYHLKDDDDQHFNAILQTAGGLPLAIKWAAQIASEKRSLFEAAKILNGAGPGKRELLNFCFTTMYDELSDIAQDAALLIPYLGSEWKPMTLSIALDLPVDRMKMAMEEISDRGIIFQIDDRKLDAGYDLLPLTKEFLSRMWDEAERLQHDVKERIAEMFSSGEGRGILLDLPIEQRMPLIKEVAREKAARGEEEKALKLVQLAQTWKPDPSLRFMEGQLVYRIQSRDAGIAHMAQAIKQDGDGRLLSSQDLYYFAAALFARGRAAEREAFDVVISTVRKESLNGGDGGVSIPVGLLLSFIECGLHRRDIKQVIDVALKLDMDEESRLLWAFRQLRGILDTPALLYEHGEKLLGSLDRLGGSVIPEEREREWFLEKAKEIRKRLNL